jgi:hypothetical protein
MISKTVELKVKHAPRNELCHRFFFHKFCLKHDLLRYTRTEQVTLDMRSEMRVGLHVKLPLCGPIFIRDSNVCAQVFVSLSRITFKKILCSWLVTREGRDAATASGLHQL